MESLSANTFEQNYRLHLQHLKLKGLQPKTIEAYARAIRRIGKRFDQQIDELTEQQLSDYFTELLASHSWSAVKLDLYGLKFYYAHVLRKPWVAPGLIKPPKGQRLPDIVTVEEAQRIFAATRVVSYRVFFFTLYSLGLRLGEGLRLEVGESMRCAGGCMCAIPKATGIGSFPWPRRPIDCCNASGRCIAIRCCCFRIATADCPARPAPPRRWTAAGFRLPCIV